MASLAVQLDLFEEQSEEGFLQKEVDALIVAQSNLRKGLFARHSEMQRIISRQQEEIDALKRQFALVMRNK
jgi:hypothetical protein